jgi:hypothetical protein
MMETDDRLADDPIWELFPSALPQAPRPRRFRYGLAVALLVAVSWWLNPVLSVCVVCLAAAWKDIRTGRRLARSIPDKAGGDICTLFSYAWGAWKFGAAAFVMVFVAFPIHVALAEANHTPPSPAFIVAPLFWFAGFIGSAILTAAGLVKAFRSGMRVWIGEGINQARTLMMGMLIVGFTFAVLVPMCFLLAVMAPRPAGADKHILTFLLGLFTFIIGGPVGILVVLDWLSHRVVADKPGKFGPKVPTVGKWTS